MSRDTWRPRYEISASIAKSLMAIEASRTVVDSTPISPADEAELRYNARLRSTHFSTRIEGNRLTLKQAEQIITRKKPGFHGRERDVNEVRNCWDALLKVEGWAAQRLELSEDLIRRLHALVEKGKRAKPTPYRDGQNVIRDSRSGGIVYLPPESGDVPGLMSSMVGWAIKAMRQNVPVPIIAALVHYQFVTIHPYYDGNGRTARLLATFILQRDGYGLHGYFSMEEHHARDLMVYYRSLAVHDHHNYCFGRAEADLTPWVSYFVTLLSQVFATAKDEALTRARRGVPEVPQELRGLDHRARVVLGLFGKRDQIAARDISQALGLSDRMVRLLALEWVKDGWLVVVDSSNRARAYGLSAKYRQFVGN